MTVCRPVKLRLAILDLTLSTLAVLIPALASTSSSRLVATALADALLVALMNTTWFEVSPSKLASAATIACW
jgi:hypothetical protein